MGRKLIWRKMLILVVDRRERMTCEDIEDVVDGIKMT
jgi:hypothetical protein